MTCENLRFASIRGIMKTNKGPWIREITKVEKRAKLSENGRAVSTNYEWKRYLVQGWKEDGKWQRKFFADKAKAQGFLAALQVRHFNEESAIKQTFTSLNQNQVKEAEAAFRRLNGRYTLDEVIDFFVRHHYDTENPKNFEDAIDEFLRAKSDEGLQPRSLRQLKSTLDRFLAFLVGRKGSSDVCVHEITETDVKIFLESLRDRDGIQKAKRKTYNNNRLDLSSFFSWASDRQRKFAPENPVTAVKHFDKKAIEQQRQPIDILSPAQVRKLFEFLVDYKSGEFCRYYALLLFAGLRPESEAVRLSAHKRQNDLIDLEHLEIELPAELTPKSANARTVTIRPNLAAWLKAYQTPILPDRDVRRDLANIRSKFGLSQDICRHSWFTYSIGLHDSVSTAALEGGNSESIVKDHYLRVAKKRKASSQEFWAIMPPSRLGNIPPVEKKIAS
jgi:site-specific recombinase XerD